MPFSAKTLHIANVDPVKPKDAFVLVIGECTLPSNVGGIYIWKLTNENTEGQLREKITSLVREVLGRLDQDKQAIAFKKLSYNEIHVECFARPCGRLRRQRNGSTRIGSATSWKDPRPSSAT